MAVSAALPTSFRTARPQTAQTTVFPAPLAGMDARVPLAVDKLDSCLWSINMLPTEYSMRVRYGYREWQIGLAKEIRCVIPFVGRDSTGSADKLFVTTEDGIYDVTTYSGTPTLKVAFGTQSADAGYGVFTSYVDESGDDMMFYADGENGLFKYDPGTETWAAHTGIQEAAGSIGTLTIANIVFVVVHKLRIWLFEKDANKAWYLPIRSATGDAQEFFFASKFKRGGDLVGLYNWTIDGGQGRDDHLVAISRGGDVIPWAGEDPTDVNTWTAVGTFFVGEVPKGRRVASEYGGELFVLSKYGITAMGDLLRGATIADPFTNSNQINHKISRLLRTDLDTYGDNYGWSVQFIANIGSLMISMPKRDDGRYRQYIYNLATGGWGLWRDVPIHAGDTWTGALTFGDEDGNVFRMDVDRDYQTIAGGAGEPVSWFVLTNYSHLQAPGGFKRTKFVRPNFIAEVKPLYEISAHYDYQDDEPSEVSGTQPTPGGAIWDTGLWGDALWGADITTPFSAILGAEGIGRSVAIALVGSSTATTDLASFDIIWETGGML